ncbi:hypothetical protein M426DRAFT_155523 [Hypoxylon sp. CI-4A]|nr:hypothetical protein M426DRAFT_155523 [Hypoxylon sp. CI-4A]
MPPHSSESPAKKQTKWTGEEDSLIIVLRQSGMKWDDISKRLPGRSPISCRLHYQNYLERRGGWDEEKKNKLARLYESKKPRFKQEMWYKVADEMGIPWRAAEAMHWQLGEQDIARRAGVVTPFTLQVPASEGPHGGPRPSPRHAHSHSQGSLSREVGPGRGYSRGGAATSRPIASRRESIPRHVPVYPEHAPDTYGYQTRGMPLAPINTQNQPSRPGMLPGVAELTTGVSPYSTPAYSIPLPNTSPATNAVASPGPFMTHMHYGPLEPTGSKRRRSPDFNALSPEMSRRRHLDPRP